jgi:hypothetical protein
LNIDTELTDMGYNDKTRESFNLSCYLNLSDVMVYACIENKNPEFNSQFR